MLGVFRINFTHMTSEGLKDSVVDVSAHSVLEAANFARSMEYDKGFTENSVNNMCSPDDIRSVRIPTENGGYSRNLWLRHSA